MWSKLKNMFTPPEYKASRTGRVVAVESGGRARWSPRDYAALAREGYMRNAIVYRAVRLLAESIGSLNFVLYEGNNERDVHPLLDLIRRPNPRQDGASFLESVSSHLLLSGNAYIEAIALSSDSGAMDSGNIRELYALRPDRMKLVSGPDGWPRAYDYTVAGQTVRFDQAGAIPSILHLTFFNPLDDHYGMGPLEAAAIAVDTHNSAAGWNKALLDHSARPSGALVFEGEGTTVLNADQFERIRTQFSEQFQGAANAGRPLVLDGGLTWTPMSLSPRDMDFLESKHAAAREIALAFGIPPMLLAIPGDNTYSNYQEANRVFWRQSVLPLAGRIACALTSWLAPAFGNGLFLAADTDRIEALNLDRAALWERVSRARFLTINEQRLATGYSPVEGGDVFPQPQ
jgi:HK97 family phage portal protein